MKALLVPPHEVPSIWSEIEPLINKGLSHTTEDINAFDYLVPILEGRIFLWIGIRDDEIQMSLVLEPIKHQRETSLFIHAWSTKYGYDFDEWLDLFHEIENFGRINGCDFVETKARKGLAKKLKKLNWTDTHSIVTKRL
tara:strand:+ start:187 stop:603 length:417 start_codon:yes stop_codon:yes gene_type:complete